MCISYQPASCSAITKASIQGSRGTKAVSVEMLDDRSQASAPMATNFCAKSITTT